MPSDSLLVQLGADSLQLARFSSGLQTRFGCDIAVSALARLPLAALERVCVGVQSVAAALVEAGTLDWQQIARDEVDAVEPWRCEPLQSSKNAVFLTGASGFLGAFVLKELLEHTNYDVICLLRNR